MSGETVTPLQTVPAPYGREVRLHDVVHDSGLHLLRVTIREGRRFTIVELDADTAARWAAAMAAWAERAAAD
jgi:hypothetical protein